MRLRTKDIVWIGMMVALLEAGKPALMVLPNIEVVSLLIILFTLFFGRKILYAIAVFVLIEGILFGFGIWWVMYLYAWPLLALVTLCFRKQESVWVFAMISGVYGLLFGAMCSLPYLFVGGWRTAFAWWIAGIPYDMLHGAGNFVVCLVLFVPLKRVLSKLEK